MSFYLRIFAAAMTVAFGAVGASGSAAADRPNILFIFADDHAYQSIGAYGGILTDIAKSPNLDRLADQGMLFNNCCVTNSICGPMRAVIQTGKYSHINGFLQNGNQFNGDQPTFPKLMQKSGYQTAVIGKWHLGEHQAPQGFNYSQVLIGQGTYYNPRMLRDANGTGEQEKVQPTGYTTDIITELAVDWLKSGRDQEKPFMLMMQHKAPHRPWDPAPRYLDLYEDETFPEPETLFDDYANRPSPVANQDMMIASTMTARDLKFVAPNELNDEQKKAWDAAYGPKNEAFEKLNLQGKELVQWKYQRYVKDYLRCTKSVDDSIGAVLKYLDDTGLADNTLVVYSSDQGFYLGEHGWFDKRWIFEESLRTPCIARLPGVIASGSKNSDVVSPLDFPETFLDIAGIDVPSDMQGRSLAPILKGETPQDWRTALYYHYYEFPGAHSVRRHYGVVDGQYKLAHFYEPDVNEWLLVDLKADPLELKNFYDDPAHRDVQKRLADELAKQRAALKVPEDTRPSRQERKQKQNKAPAKAKNKKKAA